MDSRRISRTQILYGDNIVTSRYEVEDGYWFGIKGFDHFETDFHIAEGQLVLDVYGCNGVWERIEQLARLPELTFSMWLESIGYPSVVADSKEMIRVRRWVPPVLKLYDGR